MDETLSDAFREAGRIIRRGRDRLKRLSALLKEVETCASRPGENAFILREKVESLERLRGQISELDNLTTILSDLHSMLSPLSREAFQRARSAMGSALSRRLAEEGLELSGNYPRMTCGLLSLEFTLEGRGRVAIFFGPRIERLALVPIDPEAIAGAVFSIHEDLNRKDFDEEAHITLLLEAYRRALVIREEPAGTPVPIADVLLQAAILKQDEKFHLNPVRPGFTSYGKVRFAYDLCRLKRRSVLDQELHLTVASMEQTRQPGRHLWVPRGPRDPRGTHYSMLSFRRLRP